MERFRGRDGCKINECPLFLVLNLGKEEIFTMNLPQLSHFFVALLCSVSVRASDAIEAPPVTGYVSALRGPLANDRTAEQIVLGDLDSDGDLDAWVVNSNFRSEIWLNNGSGAFTLSNQIAGAPAYGVDLADLDGDGDLDAFLACHGGNRSGSMKATPFSRATDNGSAMLLIMQSHSEISMKTETWMRGPLAQVQAPSG